MCRPLKKIDEMKTAQTSSPAIRSLKVLETEFKEFKSTVKQPPTNQPNLAEKPNQTDLEKRSRTVNFGQFPKDTKADEIKEFINKVMAGVEDVEDMFAYGKKFVERGGARFVSKESMWKYMGVNAGSHTHDFKQTKVYCNPDSSAVDKTSEPAKRERAVRKLVRAIIESKGGNGKAVKANIDKDYKNGVVWWQEQRVGEWDRKDCKMIFLGDGLAWEEAYKKLLNENEE